MAAQLRLDIAGFTVDLDDPAWTDLIQDDRSRATERGVTTGPAVLHDGEVVTGDRTLNRFEQLLSPAC